MNTEQLNALSTGDLVKEYNRFAAALDDNLVVKFADKTTAVKRVLAIMAKAKEAGKNPRAVLPAAPKEKAAPKAKAAKAKVKAPKAKKPAGDQAQRAAAITKSWKDPKVKAKRSARHGVKVDGKEFRSVKAAYEHFGLPLSTHISFRMRLKKAGKLKEHGKNWSVFEA